LVTGAAGFIGSHLCEALVAEGNDVVGVDCFTDYYPRSAKEQNLETLLNRERFTFVDLDLRSADLDPIFDGVEAVVNEAAMPGLSWANVEGYISCNLLVVQRLVEAAQRSQIRRFVQASTSSVYGANAVGDETQPTRPVSPYGVTKLAAEKLLLAYSATFGFPATIVRYFSIYGPRQRPDMAYHRFIRALARGEAITVYGDGEQTRGNTYVGDCVAGTIAAIRSGGVGETYNIGGGEVVTLLEAVAIIADVLRVDPEIHFEPARPGDQQHTAADTTKAGAELGYRAEIPPAEGLARQVAWQAAPTLPTNT
jgi:nucleoside-diphosphate-sugar epimerase